MESGFKLVVAVGIVFGQKHIVVVGHAFTNAQPTPSFQFGFDA